MTASGTFPKSGPFPPPALPGFSSTTGLSATPDGPTCPSRASGWGTTPHHRGFPVLPGLPPTDMPSPLPRRDHPASIAQDSPCGCGRFVRMTSAFPPCQQGRLSRRVCFEAFMAFTVVTACPLAESLKRPFPSQASTASLPPQLLRLLPAGAKVAGWELHPLRKPRLSRRTGMSTPSVHCSLGHADSRGHVY